MSDARIAPERRSYPQSDGGGLPRSLTSFIGRERELTEAKQLLDASWLLTLTGPGGSGKTRLCVELAAAVADDYPDGVYFVRLGPVSDPSLVASSIAQEIGLPDAKGQPLISHLADYLRDRKLLLVLDNFEHLLSAAPLLPELLCITRALRILVTSRSPLRVSGEQEYPVHPLTLPEQDSAETPQALATCESVRLFAARAAAAEPGFAVDDQNAAAIASIVRRLDGLPLAIELAAARVRLLPPEAMLARLENSLGLLIGGSRDLPDRQRTLRATIEWSTDLLSAEANELLAACSVFRGGASLDVIESVCGWLSDRPSVLDGLQELADQGLLRRVHEPESRYVMLQTIREFAAGSLDRMPAAALVRQAHASEFLALAEEAGRSRAGEGQRYWIDRLQVEHDNLRAAIDWYCQTDPRAGLRLASALWLFWSLRGHYSEGRRQLRRLLDLVPDATVLRVQALAGAAWLAIDQGDYKDADVLLAECTRLSRNLGDKAGEGLAAAFLARSMLSGDRFEQGASQAELAFALVTQAGDQRGVAFALFYRALAAQFTGDLTAACQLHEQSAEIWQELGLESLRARCLQLLGITRLNLGDLTAAREALEEGLPVSVGLRDRFVIPIGLSGFAGLAALSGKHRLALRLAGAAEAHRKAYESALPEPNRAYLDSWLAPSYKAAGSSAAILLAEGRRMSLNAAVERALARAPAARRAAGGSDLTPREQEVAALAARGLSNREIATRLTLSVRTAETHVDHVLTKLGFRSRAQLAAWAHTEGLLAEDT
jgi:predicted ATPase/DNA-binding CsgD family transcriptional regulator